MGGWDCVNIIPGMTTSLEFSQGDENLSQKYFSQIHFNDYMSLDFN